MQQWRKSTFALVLWNVERMTRRCWYGGNCCCSCRPRVSEDRFPEIIMMGFVQAQSTRGQVLAEVFLETMQGYGFDGHPRMQDYGRTMALRACRGCLQHSLSEKKSYLRSHHTRTGTERSTRFFIVDNLAYLFSVMSIGRQRVYSNAPY